MISQAEIAAEALLLGLSEEVVRWHYLPHWASDTADGEWVQYAQLSTKDGRRMGNALILAVTTVEWDGQPVDLHTIFTDYGNILELTERELASQFHPPKWKIQVERVERRVRYILDYKE
ncbi:hypothetical protein [Pseudomonas rossensis]|uniref:hypothetical protein n=1 Tax=Pseudomonas rossensis TaxID=2305471 RepID=UPI0032602B58